MTVLFLHINHSNYHRILLLVLGLCIRYQIGRRRFNRRSITGIQLYSSYFKGVVTTILETLLNLLGALCIMIAIITIIIHL
ncbi:hypothetical protein [Mucilaginibacter sp. RCC_168]|uniref:hypothetical protein n=1 Tax=Mucilaginibacter sp. RCC_168 TaxID=3239221 RepID=UPI003526056B